jgi:hypothetical protein
LGRQRSTFGAAGDPDTYYPYRYFQYFVALPLAVIVNDPFLN